MKHKPVTLRRRLLPSGNQSLYLDIYDSGVRSYEYLHLYLIPERNRDDKAANKATLRLAEDIAARRLTDFLEVKRTGKRTTHMRYCDLFGELAEERKESTSKSWNSVKSMLKRWRGWDMSLGEISPDDVRELRYMLDHSSLSQNSKRLYYSIAATVGNAALKRELIMFSPFSPVEKPKAEQTNRVHLTIDELGRLAATPCLRSELKRAFMFAALTGLRKSDIRKLQWSDITSDNSRIIFRQKKTGSQEYLDISPSAAEWLGERKEGSVFDFNGVSIDRSDKLRRWARDAGVDKLITFHSARHTFACMMIELDTDIYTISKLLGHSTIATTQVYAKIVDKRKREAVGRIPHFKK